MEIIIAEYVAETARVVKENNELIASYRQLDAASDKTAKDIDKDFDKVEKAAKDTKAEVNRTAASVQKMGTQSTSALKGVGSQFASLKQLALQLGPAIGVAFGVQQVIAFGKESVAAYIDAEKNASLLLNSLNGNVAVQQRLLDQASRIQDTTIYDDDTVQRAQTFLATQGRTEEQITKTIDAAIELSAVTGDDLQTSVEKLDATYEGSIGRLGKLDERFKTLTKEQLANGAAIDLVKEKYEGFAVAAGETTAGKIEKARNQLGELQEFLGGQLVLSVGDAIDALNSSNFDGFISNLDEAYERINPLGLGLGAVVSIVDNLNDAFKALSDGDYGEALSKIGTAAVDYYASFNPLLALTRKYAEEVGYVSTELSEAEQIEQRLTARQNTFNNAVLEGGDALEVFYKRAAEVLGATRKQFDDYVAVQRAKIGSDKEDNEQVKEKITYLQGLNKELAALTSNIQNTVAQGGVVKQADIDRVIALQDQIKKAADEYARLIQRTRDRKGFNATATVTVQPVGFVLPSAEKSAEDLETENLGKNTAERDAILKAEKEAFFKNYTDRQQFLKQYAETDAERAELQYNMELMALQKALDDKIIAESDYIGIRKKLYEDYSNFQVQIEAQNAANLLGVLGESVNGIGQIYAALAEDAEENANFQKAIAIFDATLKLGQAIAAGVATAASSGDPYTVAARVAAAAISIGAALAGVITSIKSATVPSPPAFFKGTPYLQRGNNPVGRDTIPVMANEGEAIIPTDKNAQYPGLANAWINGDLSKYVQTTFAAPMIEEGKKKMAAHNRKQLAEAIALSISSGKFNDGRLFGAAMASNSLLMEIAENTRNKKNKRSVN